MKITLFTSNNQRHNYFINLLSNYCDELYVIQEFKTLLTNNKYENSKISTTIKNYFNKVEESQNKFFKKKLLVNNNIKTIELSHGELSKISLSHFADHLKTDIYIIFGSSYIKGDLADFLIRNKGINIHAGVSPYYRGADCNFWALYDGNPHLVGATIHLLSKGLDSGPILYHAMSNLKLNPFDYTMSTVKSAFHSIVERISDNSIFHIDPIVQNKISEIRYSRKIEFTEKVVKNFFKKEINLDSKNFDNSLLKDPFFLEN